MLLNIELGNQWEYVAHTILQIFLYFLFISPKKLRILKVERVLMISDHSYFLVYSLSYAEGLELDLILKAIQPV